MGSSGAEPPLWGGMQLSGWVSFSLVEKGREGLMKQPYSFSGTFRVSIALGVLALSLLASGFMPHATTHAATRSVTTHCDKYVVPVHLSVLGLTTYHVASWLCYQQTPGNTVQLLVHGGTYGHIYWDFPCPACQTGNYSYVQYMAQAGYTTFSYDRLGYGESDHPLPELVTIQMAAYVLSQLMADLKTGSYGGPTFQKIVLVGHSIGSAVVIDEAADATLTRPDGVILSGFLHAIDLTKVTFILTMIQPALLDPNPRLNSLLPGYLTTIPGTRGQIFYDQSNADPNVIAEDEATKEAVTDSELTTFFTIAASTISQLITVPVLEAAGQFDNIFCLGAFNCTNTSVVQNEEAHFFSPSAQLQVIAIPQAGHVLNLQENATTAWYPQVSQWLKAHTF